MNRALVAAHLLVVALAAAAASALPTAVLRGDAAFAARAVSFQDERADPAETDASIQAYREAVAADPAGVEARWRLLRSLHYLGDFTRVSPDARRTAFEEGSKLGEESIAVLSERLEGEAPHDIDPSERRARLGAAGVSPEDVARLYFWAGVHWAAWSREAGLLQSVRKGVANRVHDYALVTIDLEPAYERGGAHRLLARLHGALPKVPFVSGWVDRSRAVPEAEAAMSVNASDPGNRYLLGLTLVELAPEREAEARDLLRDAADAEPRPELLAEDVTTSRLARKLLDSLEGPASALSAR